MNTARRVSEYGSSSSPLVDRVSLTLRHALQRGVELWGSRPSDSAHGLPAIVRRTCARLVAALPLIDRGLDGWRDVIALDLQHDAMRAQRVEARITAALSAARPAAHVGDGVVMVIPSLALGGSETQLAQLALALKQRGHSVRVIVKHGGVPFDHFRPRLESAQIAVEQIVVQPTDIAEIGFPAIPPLDLNLYRMTSSLTTAFRRLRPAAVHGWLDEMGAAAALAAVLCGVPRVIVDCRSLRPTWFETRGTGSIRAVLRVLVARGDVTLVNNSRAGADDYVDWLGVSGPFQVIRNALDGAALDAAVVSPIVQPTPNDRAPIGGMMRLSRAKQPELWLRVARRYLRERPDATFWLFGDGPLRSKLERTIRRWRLGERIILKGTPANTPAALSQLAALLLTSDVEGTPNVALEAQWLGVPVVARGIGGIPEAIAPELRDLLADSETGLVDALTRAVLLRRESVIESGQRFIQDRYDLERQLREYLAAYDGVSAVRPS
jgi:glycosyltransferase involved in cell wall biosynthesis